MTNTIPTYKILQVKFGAIAEEIPTGEFTNVIRFDSKPYKITDCIQLEELIETLKTFQLN